MRRALLAALAALSLLPAVSVHGGEMELAGSSTVAQEIIAPLAEPFRNATGAQLKIQAIGTGKGMIALLQGKVKAAMASESLEEALFTARLVAKREGVALAIPPGLVMTRLRANRLVVIVHRDNPVVALTRTQIKDIFTGRITNWKELGGADLPVEPLASVLGNAVRTVIQHKVMDGEDYRKDIRETAIPGEATPIVSREKGAIAVVSLPGWSGQTHNTRIVNTPELTHPLGLITIGQPDAEVRRLIGFIRANSRI